MPYVTGSPAERDALLAHLEVGQALQFQNATGQPSHVERLAVHGTRAQLRAQARANAARERAKPAVTDPTNDGLRGVFGLGRPA